MSGERELREKAGDALMALCQTIARRAVLTDEQYEKVLDHRDEIRALIAYLDAKCERAFRSGMYRGCGYIDGALQDDSSIIEREWRDWCTLESDR
jgi:hypothetical protein